MADEIDGDKLKFNFKGDAYVAPDGDKLRFNFTINEDEGPGDTQYVFPVHFDASVTSIGATARLLHQFVRPIGFNVLTTGTPAIKNTAVRIYVSGFNALAIDWPGTYNKTKFVRPGGSSLRYQ